ncbi:MAG: D-glycero-alpha-D-manno-heptose-1,7-bisphosphate 7-phosphatase [Candidatus Nanoarchaeia archaeon]
MKKEAVIFLDKDGTLVDNAGYPEKIPSDELLDNIIEGLRYLQDKNYKLIIISNQPWISKNKLTKQEVEQIFSNLINKLNKQGIKILDYFYCPHQSSDNCNCKKPKPGLIHQAINKYNIDLNHSYIIGDMDSDIALAKNLGIPSILVLTGRGRDFMHLSSDYVIENINQVKEIL